MLKSASVNAGGPGAEPGGNVRAPLSPLMSQRRLRFPADQRGCIRGGGEWRGVHQDLWAEITQLKEFKRSRFHP